ncbi:MAG: hypothetical protein Phyf2KO_25170 [Phycisphaerales bacterium]
MATDRKERSMTRLAKAAALTMGVAGLALTAAPAVAATTAPAISIAAEPTHEILLTTGQTVKVEIVEENDGEVETVLWVGTMSAPKTYQRSEIISITELSQTTDAVTASAGAFERADKGEAEIPANATRVFVMNLEGVFGWDISRTPVKNAMDEARDMDADLIIVKCNNNWKRFAGFDEERYDDEGSVQQFSTAQDLATLFSEEMRAEWAEEPKVVFWVDRAMSGMAFLPLIKEDIYFTSEGRLGGVGNLEGLFDGIGDTAPQKKQESLRRGRMEGMAIEGGHDFRLVRAMVEKSYVLSYKIENGQAVLMEGEAPGDWILMTDDGEGANQDTDVQMARNLGNDSLTFDSDLAYKVGFSKGTADNLDDLFFEMGIEDTAYVLDDADEDGQSDASAREMTRWSEGVVRAQRKLARLQYDIDNVQVRPMRNDPDGSKARNAARGQQKRLISEAIRLLNQYGEVLDPGEQTRIQLELMKQQLDNEGRLENLNRRGNGPG